MSYATLTFWIFLIISLAGLSLSPARLRGIWLTIVSLWFYASVDPMRLAWLGGVTGLTLWAAGIWHPPYARAVRSTAIALLVMLLIWAKFSDAMGLPDPKAPPGLSFLVFTAIALIVETARRGTAWSVPESVLHLVWFPKILAGPIERPGDLIAQFPAIGIRPGLMGLGVAFIVTGLVKKLVIANALAPVVDAAYAIPSFATPVDLLVATYAFAFQIYCDFSGYADLALGLSALVGLRLSRNFAQPYLSPTVTEFWAERWHITLGRWFRDYVYIPLGGSRRGRPRQMANLMLVFLLSGIWHAGLGYGVGWGFLIWGVLNGALVIAELWVPRPKGRLAHILRTVLTFHLILVTWVFFRAETPSDAVTILMRISAILSDLPRILPTYPFTPDQRFGAVLVAMLLVLEILNQPRPLAERIAQAPLPLRWAGLYIGMAALLLFGRWQDAEFIYAGF
ncbi:MBOAT family O-acyltransferase [Roseicyclus marinus]|uniref:Probable alginate O-acetylase AlgI n=1 Tax=Roseicyclus marinus TaxID=2161673 RepID=A0AA48KNU4_9RHOB|nr:alginate O-acetyltransferase [Roseicyclus marinus]